MADDKKECTPLGLVGFSPSGHPLFKQLKEGGAIVEARPVKEGEPIHGDLVSLHETPLSPLVFGSHVEYSSGHKGPAQVATREYRDNYDAMDWGEDLPN